MTWNFNRIGQIVPGGSFGVTYYTMCSMISKIEKTLRYAPFYMLQIFREGRLGKFSWQPSYYFEYQGLCRFRLFLACFSFSSLTLKWPISNRSSQNDQTGGFDGTFRTISPKTATIDKKSAIPPIVNTEIFFFRKTDTKNFCDTRLLYRKIFQERQCQNGRNGSAKEAPFLVNFSVRTFYRRKNLQFNM